MFSRKLVNLEQYQQVINLAREMLLSDKLSYVLGVNKLILLHIEYTNKKTKSIQKWINLPKNC